MIKALGYDPGGKGRNGVAWVKIDTLGQVVEEHKKDVGSNLEALEWLYEHATEASIIGIDTMLAWSFKQRSCDEWIRKRYNLSGGKVQSLGSLRGAMLANGLLVAREFHLRGMELAEAHPKALRVALGDLTPDADDHGDDARLGAIAAASWKAGIWSFDLFQMNKNELWFPAGSAAYPWPDE